MTRAHELPFAEADARVFVTVAQVGSFTEAAALHSMTPSAVSKAISRLEAAMGMRLLTRTTRSLHLTDEGILFHEKCAQAFSLLSEAAHEASHGSRAVAGTVRLGLPPLFGTYFLPEVLPALLTQYPSLRIEIVSTLRQADLVDRGLDVMIVVGELTDSSFSARPLGHGRFVMVASPNYLQRAGTPKTLAELTDHTCLAYSRPDGRAAPFLVGDKGTPLAVQGVLSSDDMHHLAALAIAGLGIAQLPEFVVGAAIREKRLVRVLTEHDPPAKLASLVFPQGRTMPFRVRALLDFLIEYPTQLAGVAPAKTTPMGAQANAAIGSTKNTRSLRQ